MDIQSFFGTSNIKNRIIENERLLKYGEQTELNQIKTKHTLFRINNRNKQISHYSEGLNELIENNIIDMLNIADFVNSGSDKQNETTEKFNNSHFSNVLEKMASQKKIKVIRFNSNKHKYYYTRLSDAEVENMSETDIKSRLWQNNKF